MTSAQFNYLDFIPVVRSYSTGNRRCFIVICLLLLISVSGFSQVQRNRRPKIVGQEKLVTNEDQSITIELKHLKVEDRDDFDEMFYPLGFTLKVYPGTNYTLSGNTVIPAPEYSGTLRVPVTVNDGDDDSDPYDVEIRVDAVNDPPKIVGQVSVVTYQSKPLAITPSHLTIVDPDNKPENFRVTVYPGNNYAVSGNEITPSPGFTGSLTVGVTVSDGTSSSEIFNMTIQVNPASIIPEIVGQVPLSINEDESITVSLTHLTVIDADDTYPNGFLLSLQKGENYSLEGDKVKPAENFNGLLTVGVLVNDGKHSSKVFNLSITVLPVNDAPKITKLETMALGYQEGRGLMPISRTIEVVEPDNEKVTAAEIGFKTGTYKPGEDELVFADSANISGSYDAVRGIMKLSGNASAMEYSLAIRSVKYQNIKLLDASREPRKLYIILSDGISESTPGERIIAYGKLIGDLDIPFGFTPNGDRANDTWIIRPVRNADEYNNAVLRVYTKYGKLVHEVTGFSKPWDGRFNGEFLPADVYYFTIDVDPLIYTRSSLKGAVTILR